MDSLAAPGVFRNSKAAKADAEMQREVRAHFDAHPGVRFLVDVLSALHARPDPVRSAAVFYKKFPASVTMEALEHRADLRARVLQALTAGPPSLTRRMAPAVITAQIELLVERDIPGDERAVRAEEDRALSVHELYLKYLDPIDLAAYLPPRELWAYEMQGAWWEKATDATRRLMAAEIKSIRRHKILTDSELIDAIGDEILERDLPLAVRTAIRGATRRAARENKPFSDTDLFDCVRTADGTRDLVDSLAESVPLVVLRNLVVRAAQILELEAKPAPPAPPPEAVVASAEPSLMESLAPPSMPAPAKPRDAETDVS
jgi:hypothetical protein